MELAVRAPSGLTSESTTSSTLSVTENIFGRVYNEALVHQVVTAFLAGGRAGTKAQKNRAAVSGGGKKPWKQKGMGRARAGTTRSPLWRTGGVTFAAAPRDFAQKINKKMYRGAIRVILSELVRQDRLIIVENFNIESPKTRDFLTTLKAIEAMHVLIVVDEVSENLYLASRNLHKVTVSDVIGLSPVDLVSHEKTLMTVAVIKQIEEWLKVEARLAPPPAAAQHSFPKGEGNKSGLIK